ncbi:TrmB family transcriptional regulator [Thermohalobacter berrensis]|uniref:TrmB family transcriptional regulator n=1 Tax=Thermohalobacter berrensis TaxID=99594 RepID=A0A419T1U1_9FIRM|nr:TrmB family transcriptional regulator [Thermohalobacter berrensis]RKD31447.1 TrmB family transcriptional regulator [Thermohalobacter berrensis]
MNNKKIEKIINELINIGLNTYEAKSYLALIQNPNISAYEISKISGVPQSKVYETIKKMVQKGLAIASGTNPVRYTALPIDEFLDRYKSNIENSISYIKENIKTLNEDPNIEYMWHFKGKIQINNKIKSIIDEAKKSLYFEMWNYEFDFFYEDIYKAKERGVNIVTVLYGKSEREVGTIYYHQMSGMDSNANRFGRWITVVADEKECLFGIYKTNENNAVWTQNKPFMLLTEAFIIHDIMIAEIYSKYKKVLDDEFGTNMKKIREKIDIG